MAVELARPEVRALGHHVLVSERYRLVLFTIPKVACTELIRLVRRMEGADNWTEDPHYQPGRPNLSDYEVDRANEILNDPGWTRATALRDPAERLLSAYLDKFILKGGYAANIFGEGGFGMSFERYLGHVLAPTDDVSKPEGLHPKTDPHWRPQRWVGGIERVEDRLDLVGDFADIGAWTEDVLRRVGAWEDHGASGWGPAGDEAVLQVNHGRHRTAAADRVVEFYDAATLARVYDAYDGDLQLGRRWGLELRRHG